VGRTGDRLADPRAAGDDVDLLHAVLGVDVADAADLRMQREARHLGARGLVGRDHPRGAGADQLALGLLAGGARDDRDVGAQLPCGQRDEDVLGVGVHARDDRACALDPRVAQGAVVGRLGLDEPHADPGRELAVGGVAIDDHVPGAGAPEIARNLPSHPAEAADDEVVGGRIDHPLHPTRGQQVGHVAGDEQLGHRHEAVEQRPDPEDRQQHAHDLDADLVGRRVGAGRRDDVQRVQERGPRADPVGQRQRDGSRGEQRGDRQPELGQAADELLQLALGAGPLGARLVRGRHQ
jgi:hypothetical protein